MVVWRSPHPDLDIPKNPTTWQWAFENPSTSPVQYSNRNDIGSYINAETKERLDFFEVKEKATHLCTALRRHYGLQPGETVSLFSTNSIWYPVAMWATVRAGGRVNGASPAYNADEMAFALKTASTRILFTLPHSLDIAVKAASQANLTQDHIILLEGSKAGFRNIQDLIALGAQVPDPQPAWSIPPGQTNQEVCGYLNFSSGTTGLPKAVMISHHNLIAQCHQLQQLQLLTPGTRYKILAIMPLFHITGLVRFCHYPVLLNGDSIMLTSTPFNLTKTLQTILTHEIEELILVPPILHRIVRDGTITPQYLPALQRTVKRWSSGSAPISPEIIQELRQMFPHTGFRQGYGATESTACISCHSEKFMGYEYATTGGLPVANTEVKVLSLEDEEDGEEGGGEEGKGGEGRGRRELGPNQLGEILARGPQITMGYLDNAAATRETYGGGDGFLRTGDVGYVDELGLIHIEDRIKEMIKVKGQQVAPAELEDCLLGHERVEDCAVVGVKEGYAGERAKGFVVLKGKGTGGDEEMRRVGRELLAFVRERKVRYKWLVQIEFCDDIPKSSTGKLLRRMLKARDRDEKRVKGVCVSEKDVPIKARL
ncbi:acetyl-CoA synthetase-like protein [Hortaea werneckii]|uniref:AMP-dependent synthetase/ligase domain-containing protein n=1 Tax=Hortaea werneckii TaxID=91943 RepID=A0A3M7H180_HORWE|nr:acetyl-CoA synthetase-like protein [Hortaea werneckii]KAI7017919.1 acetyl-CoA synthetase-like protein [Hortaea werneckii]KAI7124229.1 acetyl-CoA synthetase-like protein [Hortaea werneckii]KAI7422872.1 acetyl-CoA synthetase-like protein [Hortaea werneckii]KAI7438375.1 acetyl-CoA synthetase-like protein [Hortaea werneckii]